MVVAEMDVDGKQHLVKLSRYTITRSSGRARRARRRFQRRKQDQRDRAEPDEYELYDLTLDPLEPHNLAHPEEADDRSRALLATHGSRSSPSS